MERCWYSDLHTFHETTRGTVLHHLIGRCACLAVGRFEEFKFEGLAVHGGRGCSTLPSHAEVVLQRPLVHVAYAVDHDTALTYRIDHVNWEHGQRCGPELPLADLEAVRILNDITPTAFQFVAKAWTRIRVQPFEISLCISSVLPCRSRYKKDQAHFPRSFFRCSITSSIV